MSLALSLVFIAAFVYAAGALLIKRSAELGAGVWRTAFVANVISALMFQPLLVLGGSIHLHLWWQPASTALLFIAGQWLSFISLERGDVSVATPVLGIKILLVAILVTALAGDSLPWPLWVSSVLATAGIALLHRGGSGTHHHIGRTVTTAGLAATCYALCDVMVQTWTPAWGVGRFLPITQGLSGVLSFAFVPFFRASLRELPRTAWPWLLGGTFAFAVQACLFVSAIAKWGNVTPANVVYSSRGLWSVLLVWWFGRWTGIAEQQRGPRVLAWRLAGAVLMMSAIALVLV
jgi:drug/metabolite transporter (DMT)-like permease